MTRTEAAEVESVADVRHHSVPATNPATLVPFLVATATGLLVWTAFPPLAVGWLAWLAPAGWVWLAMQPQLGGKHPYRQLYLAGLIHQLVMIHWVRLPHWSAYFGWLALAAYLAVYLPVFIGLTRVVIHRWRWPVVVAAPCIWVGLELLRGHLLTGFSMQLLSHTQVGYPSVIQCADVFGAYGLSFAIVCVAASAAQLIHGLSTAAGTVWKPALVAAIVLGMVFGYGRWQLQRTWTRESAQPRRVALIQGSIDTTFEEDNRADALRQYYQLTGQALRENPQVSLIVWPESMYAYEWIELVEPVELPQDYPITVEQLAKIGADTQQMALNFARQVGHPLLLGSPGKRYVADRIERYNSAVWVTPDGDVIHYHKMHPVLFGEYVPGGRWFPWLYRLTPMPNGLTRGTAPVALPFYDMTLCPNICYENTVPHLLRQQVRQLTAQGTPPDALVTVTNDGWFWGSSQLDVHLACAVMHAVELRRPLLIAANTGFSASIDAHGRVLAQGPRRDTAVVEAEIAARADRTSLYERSGDSAAAACLLVCLLAAVSAWRRYGESL